MQIMRLYFFRQSIIQGTQIYPYLEHQPFLKQSEGFWMDQAC